MFKAALLVLVTAYTLDITVRLICNKFPFEDLKTFDLAVKVMLLLVFIPVTAFSALMLITELINI